MNFTELKDLILSLKMKDELGFNDLILVLDSKSPKGTDGAIKVIKGNALKPEVTKKDLEALRQALDKRLEGFKQPNTIIVDNSELEKRLEEELKALDKRFKSVEGLTVDIRQLDDKFTSLTIPKDLTETVDKIDTEYNKQLASLVERISKIESKPEPKQQDLTELVKQIKALQEKPEPKQQDLKPLENQLAAQESKIKELSKENKVLYEKAKFNLTEILKLQSKPEPKRVDFTEDIIILQEAFTTSLKEVKETYLTIQKDILNLSQALNAYREDTNTQVQNLSKQIVELQNTKQIADRASQQAKAALDKLRMMDKQNVN